jgi:hypothetical protein
MPPRRSKPDIIPCSLEPATKARIREFADELKASAHTIGTHGLSETEFIDSALFHAAIERLRGQQSATMTTKRAFISQILDHMKSVGAILEWESTGQADRHDYQVTLPGGRIAVIEAKGCLDGNNTTIFERPMNADEFVIWSLCQNPGADPKVNALSGIHTRLSADIISRGQKVDALIIWDMLCGTVGRPCPKLKADSTRGVVLGQKRVPPPCVYLLPRSIPDARNNPTPAVHTLSEVGFADALWRTFGGDANDVVGVAYESRARGTEIERRSRFYRNGQLFEETDWSEIRRVRR